MPAPTFTRPVQGVAPNQYVQNTRDEAAINEALRQLWLAIAAGEGEEQVQLVLDAALSALSDANRAEVARDDAQGVLPDRLRRDVATLIADDDLTYTAAQPGTVTENDIVRTRAEGFSYRVLASGATDEDLTTAGGVKLRVLPGANGKTPLEAFGVVLDGSTDNTATLAAIATARASFTGTFSAGPGVCKLDGTFALPRHASLNCRGTVFDASGGAGTYDTAVIYKKGAVPTAIADLSASPAKGAMTLTFAAAHGLSVGDTILIYNPTDSSYSGFRTTYREGEFCKVAAVTSGTAVELDGPIMGEHSHTASDIYKCADMAIGVMEGFTAKAPGAGVNGGINAIRVEFAEGVTIDNVRAEGSDNASMALKQCYRCSGSNIYARQWGRVNLAFGTYYGLSIANCQELRISGTFIGDRHGVTTGGFDDFSIPCRGIIVHDFEARSDSSTGAIDFHGNTEYSTYCDGICYGGGIILAGDFNSFENIQVIGGPECEGIICREMSGMSHTLNNIRIETPAIDAARGIALDIGGNDTTTFNANTKRGGHFKINNMDIKASAQERGLILIRNRGYTGSAWSVSVDGLFLDNPTGLSGFGGVVRVDTVSGDSPASVSVENWTLTATANKSPLTLGAADVSVPVRMSPISGSVDLTTSTGVSQVESLLDMPVTFPKTPQASVALVGTNTTGTDRIAAIISFLSSSQIRPRITRSDEISNFTGAATKTVTWQAMLAEF